MCGIHLIIQKTDEEEPGRSAIHKMATATAHRGPDGSSTHHLKWDMEQIWVGHNLLAISDTIENARQPMLSADGQCGIVFNGQLYNYPKLKTQLEAEGHVFRTHGDTEVLLQWLRAKGRKGLRHLSGMFAFVFWNSEKQLLIIHRDGYGIKPLYYARNRHFFVVSSEPAGIQASDLFKFLVDNQSIGYYLRYKFIPDPLTPWLGIRAMQPGEAIEYWESKPMHYHVQGEAFERGNQTLLQALDQGFGEIIPKNQAVGLMVSGGIDSSLIWHWCLQNGVEVVPFSIRFTQERAPAKSDQEAVEILAARFNKEIQWVDVQEDMYVDIPDLSGKAMPLVADSAWYLTQKIAGRAREMGLRILLSGAGADEWFGGYRRHWYYHQWERYGSLLPSKLQFQIVKRVLAEPLEWHQEKEFLPNTLWDKAVSLPLSPRLLQTDLLPLTTNDQDVGYLDAAFRWDQRHYLVNDVLAITDHATMMHGVEGRFPFLHPAITGWASSFSAEYHLKNGRKWMLRELVEAFAGRAFAHRRKQGFGVPMKELLQSPEGQAWQNTIWKQAPEHFSPWLSTETLRYIREKADRRPEFWAQQVFALCLLGSWLEGK